MLRLEKLSLRNEVGLEAVERARWAETSNMWRLSLTKLHTLESMRDFCGRWRKIPGIMIK